MRLFVAKKAFDFVVVAIGDDECQGKFTHARTVL